MIDKTGLIAMHDDLKKMVERAQGEIAQLREEIAKPTDAPKVLMLNELIRRELEVGHAVEVRYFCDTDKWYHYDRIDGFTFRSSKNLKWCNRNAPFFAARRCDCCDRKTLAPEDVVTVMPRDIRDDNLVRHPWSWWLDNGGLRANYCIVAVTRAPERKVIGWRLPKDVATEFKRESTLPPYSNDLFWWFDGQGGKIAGSWLPESLLKHIGSTPIYSE